MMDSHRLLSQVLEARSRSSSRPRWLPKQHDSFVFGFWKFGSVLILLQMWGTLRDHVCTFWLKLEGLQVQRTSWHSTVQAMGCASSVPVPGVAPVSTNADDYFAYERKAGSQETEWYNLQSRCGLGVALCQVRSCQCRRVSPKNLASTFKGGSGEGRIFASYLKAERPCPEPNVPGVWQEQTWQMYYDNVRKVGKGFVDCRACPFFWCVFFIWVVWLVSGARP